MIVQEVSQPLNAYFLDGSLETFETVAAALDARLGYAYPENVMVLVISRPPLPAVECVAGMYVVDFGGMSQKFTPEEFAARFQVIEEDV